MWPWKRSSRACPAPAPAEPDRPALRPRPRKSNAELVADALPRSFQRTHKDFHPADADWTGGSYSAAMDGVDSRSELESVYGINGCVPGVLFAWYASQGFMGYQACAVMAQNWLIDKACSQAPQDAVQNGYTLKLTSGADLPPGLQQRIEDLDQRRNTLGTCREFSRMSRVFGIRHALFLVDGIDYEAPFNPDGVLPGSYRGISQVDPYWLSPEFDRQSISDPAHPRFYEPTWWRLPDGRRIHRSHFVISRESEVPDVLKPSYNYGGLPLPQLICERVYAAERTANEAPELAMTKRLTVLKGDMQRFIAGEEEAVERLHAFNQIRSNHGVIVMDDGEEVIQLDTGLADFDALVMTQYQLVAAIARTPATKLLGTSPKGFNATGEHESDSYDQELVSIQTGTMAPLLERHYVLLARSAFPDVPGLVIQADWNPVRAPKPGELADIELKKAQAAQARVQGSVTDPEDERLTLKSDPDSRVLFAAHLEDPLDEDRDDEDDR